MTVVFEKIEWEKASDRDRSSGFVRVEALVDGRPVKLAYVGGDERQVQDCDSGYWESNGLGPDEDGDGPEEAFLDALGVWEDVTEDLVKEAFGAWLAATREA